MHKMIRQIFLVLICGKEIFAQTSNGTLTTPCPPGPGVPPVNNVTITLFTITPCTKQPCVYEKTKSYEIHLKAIFNFYATSANKITVSAVTNTAIGTPLELIRDDLCKYLKDNVCNNIVPGTQVETIYTFQVLEVIPAYNDGVKLMTQLDGVPVYCGVLTVIVKDRPITVENTFERASGLGGLGGGVGG